MKQINFLTNKYLNFRYVKHQKIKIILNFKFLNLTIFQFILINFKIKNAIII